MLTASRNTPMATASREPLDFGFGKEHGTTLIDLTNRMIYS